MFTDKDVNIYMVGIKGVGMAMLAQFLSSKGFNVSGSDVEEEFQTDKTLSNAKIKVKHGFSLNNFPGKIDLVIRSSAFDVKKNIELKFLAKRGFKIVTYAEALGSLFDSYFGISVCGSHGKTTVTSWLGHVLNVAKLEPNVLSGSYVRQFKGSSLIGKSKYFIVESDEYQNKLQYFNPRAVILNNIDFDHPDYFKNEKEYVKVFADFIKKIPSNGFIVFNGEDKLATKVSLKSKSRLVSYFIDKNYVKEGVGHKIYQAKNIKTKKAGQSFSLYRNNRKISDFDISLMGRHNVLNSLAVIAASFEMNVPLDSLKRGLKSFNGASRRFDVLGSYKGAVVVDDYAHHPREVKACLDAVKQKYPKKKIICVFHPHTISRTKAFLNEFAESFSVCDSLFLLEIYTSAREKTGKLSSLDLLDKIKQYNLSAGINQDLKYFKDMVEVENELRNMADSDKVFLLLGAGDVFRIAYKLLNINSSNI
ncbi:MAG: UDP-N-acetylmuramate--L-alanine ligase [Patescibacteria group bacterium]